MFSFSKMNFRKISLSVLILLIFTFRGAGQGIKIGGGYFGETISHPGIVGEIESERLFTDQIGLSTRFDLGFYHHPGNSDVLFADISYGFRRYFKSGLFMEQSFGIGTMASYYNEDVWHIDPNGNAVKVSRFGNFDLMPSVSAGMGYVLNRHTSNLKLFWLRPKIFWQLPFNNKALPHIAIQAGFTFTLNRNEKNR
jgi:hypothetical protein